MARFTIRPEALPSYLQITRDKIQAGQIVSMRQVLDRFADKQFMELTGLGYRRLKALKQDWSQATALERSRLRHGLGITSKELEGLI